MPRGDKSKYTDKQQRKAERIEESYEARGVSSDEAEARAWATVNKQSGGGERSGGSGQATSGRAKRSARADSGERAAEARKGRSPNRGSARTSSGRTTGAASNALEEMTVAQLRTRAAKENISGRSRMRKAELVKALRAA